MVPSLHSQQLYAQIVELSLEVDIVLNVESDLIFIHKLVYRLMPTDKPELWRKLNALRNKYNNNETFVADMDKWPRTIRQLIFNSEKLMIHFELVELIPDLVDEEEFIGME